MIAGVDIGGTKTLVGIADAHLEIAASQKFRTPSDGETGLRNICDSITALIGQNSLKAIAICAAGPHLDLQKGIITDPVNYSWKNVAITQALKRRFNVPVLLENDANAAAYAEAHMGSGYGYRNVLYVSVSTGIGTGVIVGGKVFHGRHDTEGGHIIIDPSGPVCACGGKGHFEAIVSGRAIQRDYGKIAAEISSKKDWNEISLRLAQGLYNLICVYSPDCVVLGGGVGGVHFKKYDTALKKHLMSLSPPYPLPEIKPAKFAETAPMIGSFLLAAQALHKAKRA